jgi:hypothetical protein
MTHEIQDVAVAAQGISTGCGWISLDNRNAAGESTREESFTINAIVRDLELRERDWAADLLAGYFCQASAPWER